MKYLIVLIALWGMPTYAEILKTNQTEQATNQSYYVNVSQKKKQRVIMYSANRCHFCKQARHYFIANRIPFLERNIDRSISALNQFKAMKAFGTPLIVMGKRKLVGFSVPRFQRFYR